MECIIAHIFRDNLGDCSNGGLSSKTNEVYVPCPTGPYNIAKDNPKLVRLVTRDFGFGSFTHAEPVKEVPKGHVGYMMGGTFIYSSDSRFPSKYPIPLHDRTETQEFYNSMD